MQSPEQVRDQLQAAAARYGDEHTVDVTVRWKVIEVMELAWASEPGKVRAERRRSCCAYLFGQGSTTRLSDAHIAALYDWLVPALPLGSVRLLLRAALVDAGQAELALVQPGVEPGEIAVTLHPDVMAALSKRVDELHHKDAVQPAAARGNAGSGR